MASGTLQITRADEPGIVAIVAGFLVEHGCNIDHADQYLDPDTGLFQQRIVFELGLTQRDKAVFEADFEALARARDFTWRVSWVDEPMSVAILVSQWDHCLWDLLLRHRAGELPCRMAAVISNHPDAAEVASVFGVPFHHLPVDDATRADQERAIAEIFSAESIGLGVLARYMQVLTPGLLEAVGCPLINIHHSFLPAFSGGRPYHQARQRGVKFVGATAHYVTGELDAGPIIAQDVIACSHQHTVEDLVRKGRDVERMVLARAVRWQLEDRILLGSGRAVVFE